MDRKTKTAVEREKLMRVRAAAERADSTHYFIRSEIRAGRLRALRLGGGKRPMLRIRESDFEAWLAGDDADGASS